MLAARAGIGRAFSQLPPSTLTTPAPRVGFSAINKGSTTVDNVATRAVITGVRTFDSGNRQTFFDQTLHDLSCGRIEHFPHRTVDQRRHRVHRGVEDSLGPHQWLNIAQEFGLHPTACQQRRD